MDKLVRVTKVVWLDYGHVQSKRFTEASSAESFVRLLLEQDDDCLAHIVQPGEDITETLMLA